MNALVFCNGTAQDSPTTLPQVVWRLQERERVVTQRCQNGSPSRLNHRVSKNRQTDEVVTLCCFVDTLVFDLNI